MNRPKSSGGSVIRYILDRLQALHDKEHVVVEHLPMSDREVRDSVKRNLHDILNSRVHFFPIEKESQLARSIFSYGILDFLGMGISMEQSTRDFKKQVERAIAWYEPRLTQVSVEMSVHNRYVDRRVFLKVSGVLMLDNKTERIVFETAVQPEANSVTVE